MNTTMHMSLKSLVVIGMLIGLGAEIASAQEKSRLLILGDSISMGYTPAVARILKEECTVIRPHKNDRQENCQGTTYGVNNIDRWLELDGGKWDIIHFNFGLHDIKRVHPETKKNSNDPSHPNQADLKTYEKQLRSIVEKLKKTGAKLIFATTTPVPSGVRPHRDSDDPGKYNDVALKIMKENDIPVNDLYKFASDKLAEIQKPNNVHFTPEGSRQLGEHVAKVLREQLK